MIIYGEIERFSNNNNNNNVCDLFNIFAFLLLLIITHVLIFFHYLRITYKINKNFSTKFNCLVCYLSQKIHKNFYVI